MQTISPPGSLKASAPTDSPRAARLTFADVSAGRVNNLDFLRFFLATWVVFTHSFNILYGDGTDPLTALTGDVIGLGGTAVDFFFVLSGFLITASWMASKNVTDFIRKRVLRIYPAFLVATLFGAAIAGPLGAENPRTFLSQVGKRDTIKAALQLRQPHYPPTFVGAPVSHNINGSLWTIHYEGLCYLLVVLFGLTRILRVRAIPFTIFAIAVGAFTLQSYFANDIAFWKLESEAFPAILGNTTQWPRFLSFFMAGMTFYLYRERIPYRLRWFLLSLVILAILMVPLRAGKLLMPIFGAYILLYVAFNSRLRLHNFGKYGDFSYGIYLYSFPIQQLMVWYYADHLNWFSMFLISLTLSLMFAFASWHIIEKRFLKLKKIEPKPLRWPRFRTRSKTAETT